MIDYSTYEKLSQLTGKEQETFTSVLSRAMAGRVMKPVDGIYSAQDREWVFIEKHADLMSAYLAPLGWEFQIYPHVMRARAVHRSGEHKVRLNLEHSLIAAILRQIYHEHQAAGQLGRGTFAKVSEIRERFNQATRGARLITQSNLQKALRRLAQYQMISLERGFRAEDNEFVDIDAFIEVVLTPERIREMFESYSASRASADPDADGPPEPVMDASSDDFSFSDAEEEEEETLP